MDKRALFMVGAVLALAFIAGRLSVGKDSIEKNESKEAQASVELIRSNGSEKIKVKKTKLPDGSVVEDKDIERIFGTEKSLSSSNAKEHSELKEERKASGVSVDALGAFSLRDFKVHPGLQVSTCVWIFKASAGYLPSYNGGTVLFGVGIQL